MNTIEVVNHDHEIPYFGACPDCTAPYPEFLYLNVHKTHWFYCDVHQTRWCAGWNLFSSWKFEIEEFGWDGAQVFWKENAERIGAYREVEPTVEKPTAEQLAEADLWAKESPLRNQQLMKERADVIEANRKLTEEMRQLRETDIGMVLDENRRLRADNERLRQKRRLMALEQSRAVSPRKPEAPCNEEPSSIDDADLGPTVQ